MAITENLGYFHTEFKQSRDISRHPIKTEIKLINTNLRLVEVKHLKNKTINLTLATKISQNVYHKGPE